MANLWKLSLLPSCPENRFYISEQELRDFYEGLSLLDLERIFCLTDSKVVECVWTYFYCYLTASKKTVLVKDAYSANDGKGTLLYFYDCRIFKWSKYTREQNDLLSSFIIGYRVLEGEDADLSGKIGEDTSVL